MSALVWKDNEEYTVVLGRKGLVIKMDSEYQDYIDPKNIEVLSADEINVPWMDKSYKRVDLLSLPEVMITAIKARGF
jgi:hypothetical protein